MAATHRLAIDLGTCHTVAVVRRAAETPRSLLFDGSPLLPSGGYGAADGTLFVGRDAERMSQIEPARYEPFPKRRVDEGSVLLGDTEVPVVGLLAAVLRRVAAEALQAGVNPAGVTVLTCPADWGPQRRAVLLAAARAANLGPVELVDEPIAAASYCQDVLNQQISPGQCLGVFDFGGGTLDVTVVRRESTGLRVMAVGGLDDLGGVDFDAALVGHLGQLIALRDPVAWQRLSEPSRPAEQRDRRTFWNEVRGAKEMLSRAAAAPVQVPGREDALHLTREELERVVGPLVDRAVDETRRVFQRAGVPTGQFAGIFLVGGSSRIPLVASRLHARFGIPPTVPEQPELPVAHGALLAVGGYRPSGPGLSGSPGPAMPSSPGPAAPGSPVTGLASPPWGVPVPSTVSPAPAAVSVPPVPSSTSFPPVPVATPWPQPTPGPQFGPRPPGQLGPLSTLDARRRPRRRVARYIVPLVVLALLAACGTGGWAIWQAVSKAGEKLANAASGRGAGGADPVGGDTKKLPGIGGTISLPGTQETAVAAGHDAVYYAVVQPNKTDVVAVARNGRQQWRASVAMEPAGVQLTLVGGLLIVDGDRVDARGGANLRAVLDAKTGTRKWLGSWEDLRDVAYLGTDVIVEWGASIESSVRRVSLLTGRTKWEHRGADTIFSIDDRLSRPTLAWPSAKTPATAWPAAFQDVDRALPGSLWVDPTVVVLVEDGNGKGVAVNASTGKTKASGSLGFDAGAWTVFGGMAIGKLESTNRIQAVSLGNFRRTWSAALASGSDVDRIKPCGQNLVCAAVSGSGGSDSLVAFDLASGRQRWSYDAGTGMTDLDWCVLDGQILVGDAPFTWLRDVVALNPSDGKRKYALGDQISGVFGAAGGKAVYSSTRLTGTGVTWQVAVVDAASGKAEGAAGIGGQAPPKMVAVSETALAVINDSRELRIFKIPGAS